MLPALHEFIHNYQVNAGSMKIQCEGHTTSITFGFASGEILRVILEVSGDHLTEIVEEFRKFNDWGESFLSERSALFYR